MPVEAKVYAGQDSIWEIIGVGIDSHDIRPSRVQKSKNGKPVPLLNSGQDSIRRLLGPGSNYVASEIKEREPKNGGSESLLKGGKPMEIERQGRQKNTLDLRDMLAGYGINIEAGSSEPRDDEQRRLDIDHHLFKSLVSLDRLKFSPYEATKNFIEVYRQVEKILESQIALERTGTGGNAGGGRILPSTIILTMANPTRIAMDTINPLAADLTEYMGYYVDRSRVRTFADGGRKTQIQEPQNLAGATVASPLSLGMAGDGALPRRSAGSILKSTMTDALPRREGVKAPPEVDQGKRNLLKAGLFGGIAMLLTAAGIKIGSDLQNQEKPQAGLPGGELNPTREPATAIGVASKEPSVTAEPATPTQESSPKENQSLIDPNVRIPSEVVKPGGEVMYAQNVDGGSIIIVNNNVDNIGHQTLNPKGKMIGQDELLLQVWAQAANRDVGGFLQALKDGQIKAKDYPNGFGGNPTPGVLNLKNLIISLDPETPGITHNHLTFNLDSEVRGNNGLIVIGSYRNDISKADTLGKYELNPNYIVVHYQNNKDYVPPKALLQGEEYHSGSIPYEILLLIANIANIDENGLLPQGFLGITPVMVKFQGSSIELGNIYSGGQVEVFPDIIKKDK